MPLTKVSIMPGRTHVMKKDCSIQTSAGNKKDNKKWLLTQAAMIEMYSRLSAFE